MTPREKKLAALLGVVAVIAAGDLVYENMSKYADGQTTGSSLAEARLAVDQVGATLLTTPLSASDRKALASSFVPLVSDPLVQPPEELAEASKAADGPAVTSSGYMELGRIKIAFINGAEYTEGDQVGDTGEIVSEISQDGVTLWNTEKNTERKIPYETASDTDLLKSAK